MGYLALAQCYAASNPSGIKRLMVHLEADPIGNVTAARIKGGNVEPELVSCLEKTRRTLPLRCSRTGASITAEVSLVLYAAPTD
ncbi:MAG: hypothetical protein IT384_18410 [Deltaproteobacteria bacterium]|nr:hypothetical protein [Deltaproteobacteria bacterium]